ncbi:MAG TPA: ROK family protein [Puia sp.]|nr:ROK family protein [Puia sp.]
MTDVKVLGIDLGATNIRGALVHGNSLSGIVSVRIQSDGDVPTVMNDIYQVIDTLNDDDVAAIGIGVPSVVDIAEGIVYDVQYIPSWVEVPLKRLLEHKYRKPAFVNNDANCFALGEHYFGKGKDVATMIGLTLGTGLGGGVIINNKLFAGANCGAGEFGMLPFNDQVADYYCSGSLFKNVYGLDGINVYEDAKKGDAKALELYDELGTNLGRAIRMVMYTFDPPLIVLGGSVSQAYDLFSRAMWDEIKKFAYSKSAARIRVEVSELENSGILGAAALYFDAQ